MRPHSFLALSKDCIWPNRSTFQELNTDLGGTFAIAWSSRLTVPWGQRRKLKMRTLFWPRINAQNAVMERYPIVPSRKNVWKSDKSWEPGKIKKKFNNLKIWNLMSKKALTFSSIKSEWEIERVWECESNFWA